MRILVTGSNGYLGQGITKQLLDDGMDVIASANVNDAQIDKRATVIKGDLFEIDEPYSTFMKPDVVLHLAWRNGFIHNDLSHLEDLPKHYVFLQKMIEGGCKHVAVMGSMHEVGFYEGAIRETTPTNPVTLYGISKNALRNAVESLCKANGVVFQWLRGYYIVGNTDCGSSIFSKLVAAEKEGKKEFPFTTGQNQYDFIDYGSFCRQVSSVIEQSEINGIINIGSGYPMKLSDIIEEFIKENSLSIRLAYGQYPDRPYDSKAVWGDHSKIEMILAKRGINQ